LLVSTAAARTDLLIDTRSGCGRAGLIRWSCHGDLSFRLLNRVDGLTYRGDIVTLSVRARINAGRHTPQLPVMTWARRFGQAFSQSIWVKKYSSAFLMRASCVVRIGGTRRGDSVGKVGRFWQWRGVGWGGALVRLAAYAFVDLRMRQSGIPPEAGPIGSASDRQSRAGGLGGGFAARPSVARAKPSLTRATLGARINSNHGCTKNACPFRHTPTNPRHPTHKVFLLLFLQKKKALTHPPLKNPRRQSGGECLAHVPAFGEVGGGDGFGGEDLFRGLGVGAHD